MATTWAAATACHVCMYLLGTVPVDLLVLYGRVDTLAIRGRSSAQREVPPLVIALPPLDSFRPGCRFLDLCLVCTRVPVPVRPRP